VLSDRRVWSRGGSRILGLVASAALLVVACGGGSDEAYAPPKTGAGIYEASCATCHGKSGQGFVGPSLVDTAVEYPDVADEIAVVTNGIGEMPAWGGRFTTKQIATVVDYTRTRFATGSSTTTNPNTSGPPAPSSP
jgi:mono/diheme cytochrome c family protein